MKLKGQSRLLQPQVFNLKIYSFYCSIYVVQKQSLSKFWEFGSWAEAFYKGHRSNFIILRKDSSDNLTKVHIWVSDIFFTAPALLTNIGDWFIVDLLNIAHLNLTIVVYFDLAHIIGEIDQWIDIFLVEILEQVRFIIVKFVSHNEVILHWFVSRLVAYLKEGGVFIRNKATLYQFIDNKLMA